MIGTGRLVRVWVRVRVRVRYRYGTGTIHGYGRYGTWARKPYPCTVPMYRTDRTRTMYTNSGRNSGRSAAISAAFWVHGTGTVGTVHGYEHRIHVPYTHVPYRPYPCIVPVPYLYPEPPKVLN